ncbi:MAG: hypothetical protein IJF54_05555 [Clostridia bacterium]|nr:hypothetical protein [Clostridia bacterium]
MKKLSMLVALILCVTVGGVYATWNYAEGKTSAEKYFDDSTIITASTSATAKGTITVDTSNLNIIIDDTNGDYKGELIIDDADYVTVNFTPNVGASNDVATNGIRMQWSLSTTDDYKYNSADIFTVETTVQQRATAEKTFTITGAELKDLISLNALSLPTKADYDAFKQALHSGSIKISVSEVE